MIVNMRITSILLCFLFLSICLAWVRDDYIDVAFVATCELSSGNIILTGNALGEHSLILVLILNSNGDEILRTCLGYGISYDLDTLSDGTIVVCGGLSEDSLSPTYSFVARLNAELDTLWVKTYRPFVNSEGSTAWSMSVKNDTIWINSFGPLLDKSFAVSRIDRNGELLWNNVYGRANTVNGTKTIPSASNSFSVLVLETSGSFTYYPEYIHASSGSGTIICSTEYSHYPDTAFQIFNIDNNEYGDFYLTGCQNPGTYYLDEFCLARIDTCGSFIWHENYPLHGPRTKGFVFQANPGLIDIFVISYSSHDYPTLLKCTSSGDSISTVRLLDEMPWIGDVQRCSNGDYILCGTDYSNGFLMRVDSLGNQVPSMVSEGIIAPKIAFTAYPNPFNSKCRFDMPVNAEIDIYSLNGRLLAKVDSHNKSWSPDADVPCGIYIALLNAKKSTIAKKLLYIK